jgi:hypothetical protein
MFVDTFDTKTYTLIKYLAQQIIKKNYGLKINIKYNYYDVLICSTI